MNDCAGRLAEALDPARTEDAVVVVLREARAELATIRGRRLPVVVAVAYREDLRERVVRDGERLLSQVIAVASRTSVTLVRRTRVVAGRSLIVPGVGTLDRPRTGGRQGKESVSGAPRRVI